MYVVIILVEVVESVSSTLKSRDLKVPPLSHALSLIQFYIYNFIILNFNFKTLLSNNTSEISAVNELPISIAQM